MSVIARLQQYVAQGPGPLEGSQLLVVKQYLSFIQIYMNYNT